MKFLIRSGCGEALPIAMRLDEEGNFVRLAISEEADEEYQKVGEGLVEKAKFDGRNVEWADVVVFDSNVFNLPYEAENLRYKGKRIVGSSRLAGRLENDRAFAIQAAKSTGIRVPDIRSFAGNAAWDDAKHYLTKLPPEDKLVWKPNGEAPASTFVAESVDEMLEMLPYWRELFTEHGDEPNFIITDKIEGEEISSEGWFNGDEFYLSNSTLERTRFFDGDHGEKTGCAGNVVWSHGDTPLYHRLFDKLGPIFVSHYNGPVDINVIIEKNSNEPVFLEFTPRFGYDALFGLMEILKSDLGQLFYDTADGRDIRANVDSAFSGAVRVHIPPYPEPSAEDDKQRPVGIPIFGWEPQGKKVSGIYPVEVMLKDHNVVTSGPDGYVMVVAAKGPSPREAMEGAYKVLDKIRIPTARWRMDLATKLQNVYDIIRGSGWISESNKRSPTIQLFRRSA